MVLKKGAVSKDVIAWQEFLAGEGEAVGGFDGIFGPATEEATKKWQAKHGLKADGIVGPNTLKEAANAGFAKKSSWYPPRPNFNSPGQTTRKALFGSFNWKPRPAGAIEILGNWVKNNIVTVRIPQLVGVSGAPANGDILFHKRGADAIKGFFQEAQNQNLDNLVISWAGSFVPRRIRGGTALSNHAWGTAFDINAAENWLNAEPAPVGSKGSLLKLVPIANSFGFFWGGHYQNRKDGMHFELARL